MIDVLACDCSTLAELTISTSRGGSSWSFQDSSTLRFVPLDIIIQEQDPFLEMDGTCLSVPY